MGRHAVIIKRSAELSMNPLLQSERERVMHDIETLSAQPSVPETDEPNRVKGNSELLVMATLEPFRVVYTREADGTIVVEDVVNQRINWRLDRVIINSNKASCLTLDDLYDELHHKLVRLHELATGVKQ